MICSQKLVFSYSIHHALCALLVVTFALFSHPPPTASAGAADLVGAQKDAKQLRQALKDYLQDKLAGYKQPREYIVVDAIPRNHMGKVRCWDSVAD